AEAAPPGRPRNLAAGRLELGGARFEGGASFDDVALWRDGRADLGTARARPEVRLRLGLRYPLDRALDSHLAPERVPVEQERGARVLRQLSALPALVPGEEDEAALVELLQQHHPHRRAAVAGGRRDGHGFGSPDSGLPGLLEPERELAKRVGIEVGLEERAVALHRETSVSCRNG